MGPIQTTWIQDEEEIIPKKIPGRTKHRLIASPIMFLPFGFLASTYTFFPIYIIPQVALANKMQIYLYNENYSHLHSKERQRLGSFSYCFQL